MTDLQRTLCAFYILCHKMISK
uniref:Uncharacterized protein n=1 Tax=Rhizophora mucronata TaxID=61149 RepID=A0A2P2PMV5_RHIMU